MGDSVAANSDWDDLRERLERADEELRVMAAHSGHAGRSAHLGSKAEGVRLALSYMREHGST